MDPDPYLSNFVDPDTTNPGLKYSRIGKLSIQILWSHVFIFKKIRPRTFTY